MKKSPSPIFLGYSHQDRKTKDALIKMIGSAGVDEEASVWHDSKIIVGDRWDKVIQKTITTCGSAILLISKDFLGSEYIRTRELPKLLTRRRRQGLRLFPILVGHCHWQLHPWLADTQMYCSKQPLSGISRVSEREKVLKEFSDEVLRFHGTRLTGPRGDF